MVSIASSGSVRVGMNTKHVGDINGVPIAKVEFTTISNDDINKIVEAAKQGKIIIVSKVAGEQIKKQIPSVMDSVAIVSETIRDNSGRIIGAKSISFIRDI